MAIVGYSFPPLGIVGRRLYGAAGLALMLSGTRYGVGRWINAAGSW